MAIGYIFNDYSFTSSVSNMLSKLNLPTLEKRRQRGSCIVWEINMGVCPRLDFKNIMLFNCLGYNFNIYGAFELLCNSIANL